MDYGLLGGLAKGLERGIESYQTERSYQDKKKQEADERATKDKLAKIQGMDTYAKLLEAGGSDYAEQFKPILVPDTISDGGSQAATPAQGLVSQRPGLIGGDTARVPSKQEREMNKWAAEQNAKSEETGRYYKWNPQSKQYDVTNVPLGAKAAAEQRGRDLSNREKEEALAKAAKEKTAQGKLEKAPGEVRKNIGFITSAFKNITDYENSFNKGERQGLITPQSSFLGVPYGKLKSSTPIDDSRTNLEEAIGRLASGGAINQGEEERFRRMLPTASDKDEDAVRKLNNLRTEMESKLTAYGFKKEELADLGYDPKAMGYQNHEFAHVKDPKKTGLIDTATANEQPPAAPKPEFHKMSPAQLKAYLGTK